MYVAREFTAAATDDIRVELRCVYCGHESSADVIVTGHGEAEAAYFVGQADAKQRAAGRAVAAVVPKAIMLAGVVGCPSCRRRDPAAVRSMWGGALFAALASWPGVLATTFALVTCVAGFSASELVTKLVMFAAALLVIALPLAVLGRVRYGRALRSATAAVTFVPAATPSSSARSLL